MKDLKFYLISVIIFLSACNKDLKCEIKRFPNGNIQEIIHLNKNDELDGKRFEFFENGKINNISNFKKNQIYGYIYYFRKDGSLRLKMKALNNKRVDTLFKFNFNNKLVGKIIFGNNEDTLKMVKYYPNGKIKSEEVSNPSKSFEHILSYINYDINGKIIYPDSYFTVIKYLNNSTTRLKFETHDNLYNNPSKDFSKDSICINIVSSFFSKGDWYRNRLREVRFKDWNKVILDVKNSDYVGDKLNLVISPVLKHKHLKNYKSRGAIFVQLIKGDKTRWHNVHGLIEN